MKVAIPLMALWNGWTGRPFSIPAGVFGCCCEVRHTSSQELVPCSVTVRRKTSVVAVEGAVKFSELRLRLEVYAGSVIDGFSLTEVRSVSSGCRSGLF